MRNVFSEGYEIERDGQKILITAKEIKDIHRMMKAIYGRDSLLCYKDNIEEGYINKPDNYKRIKICDRLAEDIDFCVNLHEKYLDALSFDNGDIELDVVEFVINDKLGNNK